MSGAAATRQDRFTLLDGMRGLAALVVITDHIPTRFLMSALPGRYLAVDFFFALSGFVIAHVYAPRFEQGLTPGGFMLRRLVRLYPLYLMALLLSAALLLLDLNTGVLTVPLSHVAQAFALSLFYLPVPQSLSWIADFPFPFNGPGWSLFFELVVNAVFALIVLRLSRSLLLTIMAFSAVGLVIAAFLKGNGDSGWAWSNFAGGFARVAYAFFAGVLVRRLRDTWRAPKLPPVLAFAALLAIFMMPAHGMWRPAWDSFAAIILFPVLIACAARSEVKGALARGCAWAGLMSYGFYVLQSPVRDWTIAILDRMHHPLVGTPLVFLVTALTLAAASILHKIYDAPLRRLLSRHLFQPRSVLTAAD